MLNGSLSRCKTIIENVGRARAEARSIGTYFAGKDFPIFWKNGMQGSFVNWYVQILQKKNENAQDEERKKRNLDTETIKECIKEVVPWQKDETRQNCDGKENSKPEGACSQVEWNPSV